MRSLAIVSHVFLDIENKKTLNSGFERIIIKYTDYWDQVFLIGPSKDQKYSKIESGFHPKIILIGLKGYASHYYKRVTFLLYGAGKAVEFLKKQALLVDTIHFQFRYPSIYTYALAKHVIKHIDKFSFYIAGDGVEAVSFNYPYLKYLATIIEKLEISTLKEKKVVTTGPVLAQKYRSFAQTHAYMSTTHSEVIKRYPRKKRGNIIYVGTLEKRKRVIDLIHAIHFFYLQDIDIKCRIVGDGDRYEILKKEVKSLRLDSIIEFVGYISDEQVLFDQYDWADFLVLPSLAEGTPRVLPEAMARGVIPVAIRDVSSNNYIIHDQENGALALPKNPKSIYNSIIPFLSDSKLYEKALNEIFNYAKEHTIDKELIKMWKFVDL